MPPKEPPSSTQLQLNRIERAIESLDVKVETIDQRLSRISELLEAVVLQIGTFTEGLTRLELQMERIANTAELQQQLVNRQAATADTLAQTVAALLQQRAS